ncbi:hypothetical protein [Desulfovibrio sp. ZJ200]|uniref:hypothetical protein n=1 Tax=Desulfovibrio sp. ZJ200 TaxID=2709792 RepID=UPI0013EAE5B3|nr:hypothetical protein [Desulfovibrio sp. ZJ200]
MKRTFLLLAPLLAAALALALAAQFWLRPHVEEQLRRSLAAPAFADGVATQARAREVVFSPFSRRVLARGLEMQALPPQGPVTCHIAEISLRLPWRALLACTPLRGAILPQSGMLPVAENVVLRNLRIRTPRSKTGVQRAEISEIRAQSSLVAALLEGQGSLEPCSLLSRISVAEARASFLNVDIPTVSRPEQIRVREVFARNWHDRSLEELTLANLEFRVADREVLRLDALSQHGILLPGKVLLRRFAEQATLPLPDRMAVEILAGEMFATGEPLFRELRLHGLTVSTQAGPAELKELGLDWLSNTPLRSSLHVSGFALPLRLFTDASGFSLPGLDILRLDGKIIVEGQGKDAILKKTVIKAEGLGDLRCTLLTSGNTRGMNRREALLSQSYSDFKLKYEDRGLMARLALATAPADMAVSAFKAGIAAICALDTPENRAIAAALETFVNRPGTLELTSLPGKSCRPGDVLDALRAGDAGALVRVSAQAGDTTLDREMERLNAALKAQP